ncbi:MAG: PfkB family carbohydrate kinase [Ancrocorticia sp.]
MTGRVLHTGQVIIDIAIRVDAVPEPGGDVFGDYAGMHVGGGYNVLYASCQTGAETVYAGTMGKGSFSDIAAEGLRAIGVEHVGATVDKDLGFCVAVTDDTAERTFISTRGAETNQPLDSFDHLDVTPDDVLYITGYSLAHEDNRRSLERLAARLGPGACRTVFDVSPMIGSIPLECLESIGTLAPMWSVNEREASILCDRLGLGSFGNDDGELAAAALSPHLGKVLVRVGRGGAWFAEGDADEKAIHVPTITVDPIDTNGAGDAHSGVLCGALALGESLTTALRWANVAGALSTTVMGPATCPPISKIKDLVSAFS